MLSLLILACFCYWPIAFYCLFFNSLVSFRISRWKRCTSFRFLLDDYSSFSLLNKHKDYEFLLISSSTNSFRHICTNFLLKERPSASLPKPLTLCLEWFWRLPNLLEGHTGERFQGFQRYISGKYICMHILTDVNNKRGMFGQHWCPPYVRHMSAMEVGSATEEVGHRHRCKQHVI